MAKSKKKSKVGTKPVSRTKTVRGAPRKITKKNKKGNYRGGLPGPKTCRVCKKKGHNARSHRTAKGRARLKAAGKKRGK